MFKPILLPITKTQKIILFLLYKFRFITVLQLQKYFHHKDTHRIREWMTDLKDKGYSSVIVDESDPTVSHIFCLATNARYILEEDENCDKNFLKRLHKEKDIKINSRNHFLFLFDIYLYFLSRKTKGSKLTFLTQQDLMGYDFFPKELPDAYIAIEKKGQTDKYFLDLFDESRKHLGVIRFTTRKYIKFAEDGDWQANTKNSPFPTLLYVVQNDRRKKYLMKYGKYKLSKTFEDISLYVTTQDAIRFSNDKVNIWQKVE